VRLSRAENLLLTTDLSVTEIAAACGYGSLSYFIAEYKRGKGKTPRDARK
jgi:AraC-like DNA-binding protein